VNAIPILEVKPARIDRICSDLLHYPEIHLFITLINRSGVIVGIDATDNEALYKIHQGEDRPSQRDNGDPDIYSG